MYLCTCLSCARVYKFVCGRDSSYMAIDLIGSSGCERVVGLSPRRFNSTKNNDFVALKQILKSCESMTCFYFAVINFCGWTILAVSLWINLYDSCKLHSKFLRWLDTKRHANQHPNTVVLYWLGAGEGLNYFCGSGKKPLKSQRLESAITKNVPHGETFCLCIKLKKCGTWFATFLQNEVIRDVERFTTHFRTCLAKVFFVGAVKKRNSAFQLILQQSRKISFTFSVCCPLYHTCL